MKKLCFASILFIVQFELLLSFASVANALIPLKPVVLGLVKPKTIVSKTTTIWLPRLSTSYYLKTCPVVEQVIQEKMAYWFHQDNSLAASIIRLHFHDCAVRGCDASILLNHKGSERRAHASRTLRGFQVIDDIKAELERRCPRKVSCADILTAAARDATKLLNGSFWEVPFGRKDGRISLSKEADMVPQGRENITTLIHSFDSLGLSILDLVTLSGSHTIGRSTCYSIQHRLANYQGTGKPDPTLDAKYLKNLTRSCKWSSNYVNLDVTTPKTFDIEYYSNLGKKKGLLSTDQALYSDPRTSPFISVMATQPDLFFNQFAVSMVNLGNIVVPGPSSETEVRLNCNYAN
ncbi:hypothetical protein K2173_001218 [Erythroxylum novogranatense]|uniref:Peroxidase n=1 Tax=Erythroxylum novogranatense TaxID=1862640 RepID=A0AAV8T3B0_9ROSI|nr:hypothetical protein K2173_001218 [Erythroxylum novogranatense]